MLLTLGATRGLWVGKIMASVAPKPPTEDLAEDREALEDIKVTKKKELNPSTTAYKKFPNCTEFRHE